MSDKNILLFVVVVFPLCATVFCGQASLTRIRQRISQQSMTVRTNQSNRRDTKDHTNVGKVPVPLQGTYP